MRALALVVMMMPVARAWADEPPQADSSPTRETSNFFLESTLVGTVQRTGGILDLRLRYRRGIYESSNEAFKDNYFGAGVIEQATPIFSQSGVYAEVAPSSFFRLTAAYELVGYFGAFNTLRTVSDCAGVSSMSADDPRCAFPLESHAKGRADYGHRLWAEALTQAHFGRLIVADNFTVERWWFRDDWAAGPSADHWVNEMLNLPQSKQDLVLTNDAQVLFEVLTDKPHLMVGLDSNLAYAAGTDYRTHRVGAMGVVHLPEWRGMRDLAAVLLVQWYTNDRYTRGPIPFVGLVLTCSTPNFLKGAF
jgi:hypothetical protein